MKDIRWNKKKLYFSFVLKRSREDACLISSGRAFHDFAPLWEKHSCPLFVVFLGTCKPVLVFRRAHRWLSEFLINKSDKYSCARPLSTLKTIVLISVSIKSWIVFSPRVFRSCLASSCVPRIQKIKNNLPASMVDLPTEMVDFPTELLSSACDTPRTPLQVQACTNYIDVLSFFYSMSIIRGLILAQYQQLPSNRRLRSAFRKFVLFCQRCFIIWLCWLSVIVLLPSLG